MPENLKFKHYGYMMSSQQALTKALVLHTRPYRDTSLLVDLFTMEFGRIAVVARGAKRQKSPWRGILQPFTPLLINYYGRGELKTLKTAEVAAPTLLLTGKSLFCGFYLNELLVRLLQRDDPHPVLFDHYYEALIQLRAQHNNVEIILRIFEIKLIREIGYGLQLDHDHQSHQPLIEQGIYQYSFEKGILPVTPEQQIQFNFAHPRNESSGGDQRGELSLLPFGNPMSKEPAASGGVLINKQNLFSGKSLLAIAKKDFVDINVQSDAKRLLRIILNQLLEHKPLHSRQLFVRSSDEYL